MTIVPVEFAVASDESYSPAFSKQRLLNLYGETSPIKGKSRIAILGRPGLNPWGTSGSDPIRGMAVMADVLYVVSGANLYSVNSVGVPTLIGSGGEVADTGPVIMANNGMQLAIASGKAWVDYIDGYFLWGRNLTGHAYLYDTSGPTFGAIADPDLFLTGNAKFQWSALLNGAAYDALDFASADASPTALIRGFVDRADIFMFKPDVTEVWFNSGSDAVFERRNQTVIPKGIMGRSVACSLDNSVFFVGRDGQAGGSAIVYRLTGFEAIRVSTHAVEKALSGVADWSLCSCIGYILNGHAFMVVILDSGSSWVYDAATQLWHEQDTHDLGRWIGNAHAYAYSTQLIGSASDGTIFKVDPDYYKDGSTQIDREMISVPIGDDAGHHQMGMFQLDMETGRGLTSGTGSQPTAVLSYSDDRGETFGNTRSRSIGPQGQYGIRVIWRQLGRFRSRMVKIRITDPIKVAILDYFADIT